MMKLVDILNEDIKRQDKFINYLMPKLTEYYSNVYKDTDWFNAAYSAMHTQKGPSEYKAAALNADRELEELNKLTSQLRSTLTMDMGQVMELREKMLEHGRSITANLNLMVHLKDLFQSMSQGNFMETYSIPPGIMIELWEKWKKEIYDPEVEKRRMSMGGKQLSYMEDDMQEFEWKSIDPIFGERDTWKIYHTAGDQMPYYVTNSYLRQHGEDEKQLMFVAKDMEEADEFIDNVEMDQAVGDMRQYFGNVEDARKLIKYLKSQPSWEYEDTEVLGEIADVIKEWIDNHPEISFNTDGDPAETFYYMAEMLNDYLNY